MTLLLASACAGGSNDDTDKSSAPSEASLAADPSPRVCRAAYTLIEAAHDAEDLEAFPYVVRDAYAILAADNPNALLDRRAKQAAKVARAYTSDGARDIPGDRWNAKLELSIPSFGVYFDQGVQAPKQPMVPAPIGTGCPDIAAARLPPGQVALDRDDWTDAPTLPGAFPGSVRLTRLLLAQMDDDNKEDTMCRRFQKPLGIDNFDNIDFGVEAGVDGFLLYCAFDLPGPQEVGLALASQGRQFAVPETTRRVDSGLGPLRLVRNHHSMAVSRDRPIVGDAALAYDPNRGIGIEITSTGSPSPFYLARQVEATIEEVRTQAR